MTGFTQSDLVSLMTSIGATLETHADGIVQQSARISAIDLILRVLMSNMVAPTKAEIRRASFERIEEAMRAMDSAALPAGYATAWLSEVDALLAALA
ncbi:hypothetical protein [Paraburkholderia caffeinilytica]|uniref:Uncharacterized protein n=1 Tax=Paraburkholderia caffeinilytica TaxID=1761016 RepID=A0ABQ1LL37_9BURK|nr:hypothetical protein [Paraburkholderia caffeinilytica]GGC26205.1 hypothetical protein GCM10011400_10800 [Paraburkholderia caffeinilytica]CAB3807816.1 hypothetical protein LMG28690_06902 [Paraburkholderia caffeinilytica]